MKAFRSLAQLDGGLLIAAALTLFAIQALLKPGLPTSADLNIHMIRTLEYQQAWAAGVIVPRWAPNLAYGYGYPLFVFTPPLSYILGSALQFMGLNLENAFRVLIIMIMLLYAGGMYLLVRDLFHSVAAGLIAATAYALAPFALREALLYGGNIPQYLAIGLFPWLLWSAARAVATQSPGWIILAGIFYASLMLSHLFQVLIFTPVLVAFLLLVTALKLFANPASRRRWLRESFALGIIPLGLLLSAFFWIPVLIERSFTRTTAATYLEKSPFFVRYPHWTELVAWINPLDFRAANPHVPLTLGVVTLVLAAMGLLLSTFILWRSAINRRSSAVSNQPSAFSFQSLFFLLFFAFLAGGAVFMTLPFSRPVWELVEPLQVAQFPWRMLGLANLGLAVLAGAAILWVPTPWRRWGTVLCLAGQLWAIAPLLYPVIPFVQRGDFSIADQINYERSSQSIGTTTLSEYLPQTVARPPETSPLVEAFEANRYPERLDRASLPPQTKATLLTQNAVTHQYQIDTSTSFTLRLLHFDYPGWRATLNNTPIAITPEAETGLMLIDIPTGQHMLTVHFGHTPVRLTAVIITGLTIIALVITMLWFRITPHQLPTQPNPTSPFVINNSSFIIQTPSFILSILFIIIAAFIIKPLAQPWFTIHSPPSEVLPAQQKTDIHFANGIRLTGYDISRRVVPAGSYLQVVLYWETDRGPYKVNLQPFVHLDRLDTLITVAGVTNYTPGDVTTETNMPTFHWDNARYVRDEHDLWLPIDIPPQAYAVRVGLINADDANRLIMLADGSGDTIWLDTINVAPSSQPSVELVQMPATTFIAANDDTIQLRGYEIVAIMDDQIRFDLLWQTQQPPEVDYTIFAQLLDENGQFVTSFDRPPLDGAYPTSTWLAEQLILDERFVPLDDVPPGDYTLIVGLYEPATNRRMITPTGSDHIELSTISIEK